MSIVTANLAISLDGFTSGPDQSLEHPFGTGAEALTAWMFETDQPGREADKQLLADLHANTGAHIMGRNMFSPGRGAWDPDWTGWWGPEPPYHAPVFVLTHHERPPLPMQGGTTFTFVADGASVDAFHKVVVICAALVAAGGAVGALGIANPRRVVEAKRCAGGQLVGVPEPAVDLLAADGTT